MNKRVLIIITVGLVIVLGIMFFGSKKTNVTNTPTIKTGNQIASNVEIKDGVQYITILAKGGYSPRVSTAQAGIPSKLIVKTNGTYDCSAALRINAIGYQKILPQTGETIIDLGTLKAGESLKGLCGMGMYNFQINFN
ncbi:MAG: cupredoxin domain-containing protein [Minisyncoccia bacterium]